MLVYGDPSRDLELHGALAAMRDRLTCDSPDELRGMLIEAGEIEQAIADSDRDAFANRSEAFDAAMALTDAAARRFVSNWQAGRAPEDSRAAVALAASRLAEFPDARLRAKVPEGFAFYALYPEQYCAAATQWLPQHAGRTRDKVLVIGVRSIGTSLSAAVAAVLEAGGLNVRRLTVRPTGHPFDRRVELEPAGLRGVRHAIVVDEGPGLSGSSMAACAQALVAGGIARESVSFFPGHDRMPGSAASTQTRAWWESTSRLVVPLSELRWEGRSLTEQLMSSSEGLCRRGALRVEDLSGGQWRDKVCRDESQWPAVGTTFERMKFRVALEDGSCVLWKFAGLCDTGEASRQAALAEKGFTAPPLAHVLGFVASRWIEGEPLNARDLNASVLDRMGTYLRSAAIPALDAGQRQAAFDRIREILRINLGEALGQSAGGRACAMADAVAPLMQDANLPAYGDGRLAPHEWVRARDGRILKTDCGGHDADHTIVGAQPVLWDVAGAAVEWDMNRSDRGALLRKLELTVPDEGVEFYELAYAAFRLGFCALCAGASGSCPEEQGRLRRAGEKYLARVRVRLR